MDRNVKMMKKTLEVDAKRRKTTSNKSVIELLTRDDIKLYELPVLQYNKNVTRMSRESTNKRCMLFPLYNINTLITFISKSGNNTTFTIKWFEEKKQVEAGIASVHIFCDPSSNDIIFTTLYSIAVNGVANKSLKVMKTKFEFDDMEVVKVGKNTTKNESFRSVGYVLLENICEYMTKTLENSEYTETFEQYFENYSEITENEDIESVNFDNIANLLSGNHDINDDELLVSKYL